MSSNAVAIARRDFEDAGRSKMLLALTALLVVGTVLVYVALGPLSEEGSASETVGMLALPVQLLVPIAALTVGYMAIVGERRSGNIKLTLSLPPSRSDVVFGKTLGRGGVVVAAIAVAFLLAALLSLAFFGTVPVADLLGFAGATVLLGLTFVGIAVGTSAAVASRGRAMAIVVGTYLLFVGFWEVVVAGLYYVVYDATPPVEAETWYLFVDQLNPITAFSNVANAATSLDMMPLQLQFGLREMEAVQASSADRFVGDAPVYLQDWFGVVILLAWLVVPLLVGYYRFEGTDL